MSWRGRSRQDQAGPSVEELAAWMSVDEAVSAEDRKLLRGRDKLSKERSLPGSMTGMARLMAGPKGRYAGQVGWELAIPKHFDSTAAIRGLYPWLSGQPLPQRGPVFGREVISGGLWCVDPWEQRKLGRVGDSGVFISGVIGSGKSAGAKSLMIRHCGFGRPFAVPADIRGEWVPVAEALGGKVLRLGPGMPNQLNALAMPARPATVGERQWWLTVRSHWQELLKALVETLLPQQRELNPVEVTAVELALTEAAGYDQASGNLAQIRPISLHPVVALLRDPSTRMADEIGMTVADLRDEIRHVALALRQLTHGPMQGLVDSNDPSNLIDPRLPATVVDLSRVQASDVSVALAMACTQSVMELSFIHKAQQWWTVYDECWRLSPFPRLLMRLNAGQRRSRSTGGGTVVISHRVTDSQRGGEQSKRAMLDIITDCATKIIYRQRADAIPATLEMVTLTDMVAAQLPNLPRGRAVHVVDGDPYLVDHVLPPKMPGLPGENRPANEWDVIETDQVLSDEYRSLDNRTDAEVFGDLRVQDQSVTGGGIPRAEASSLSVAP